MSLNCVTSNYVELKSNISHYLGFNFPPPLKCIFNFSDPMMSNTRCSRRVNKSCIEANFHWVNELFEKIRKSANIVELRVGYSSGLNEEHDEPFAVKENVMKNGDKKDRRALLQATFWSRLEKRFNCLEDGKPCPAFSGSLRYEPVYQSSYAERERRGGHQCWVKSDFDVHDPGLIVTNGRTLAPWHVDGLPSLSVVVSLFAGFCWFQELLFYPTVKVCSLEDLVIEST